MTKENIMGGNEKENKSRVVEQGTRQASSRKRVPGTQPRLYSHISGHLGALCVNGRMPSSLLHVYETKKNIF